MDGLPPGDGLHRVRIANGRAAILKRRSDQPRGFFRAEARGLERLRSASGLRVPAVLDQGEDWLLLEDLGSGRARADFAVLAGHGLAHQHRHRAEHFGLPHAGWCGDSPQDNTPDADGHRFFAQRRLLPQARLALQRGRLSAADFGRVETLCTRLTELVPDQPAVLLHGDLWTGNLHCAGDGAPALIDAGAVHYSWAEAELAMLTLFGAPPQAMFDAYAEAATLAPDWRQRAPLYNLYHLLNHLNLFGAGYLPSVREVLARFACSR